MAWARRWVYWTHSGDYGTLHECHKSRNQDSKALMTFTQVTPLKERRSNNLLI